VANGDGMGYGDGIYGCNLSIEITVAALVVVPLFVIASRSMFLCGMSPFEQVTTSYEDDGWTVVSCIS
jgi:hypothetical protein